VMPTLWMMLRRDRSDEIRAMLIQLQFERYGLKLDYPRNHNDITLEPAIEDTHEVKVLMKQTRRHFKGGER